jgi:hypothetical protein
MGQFKTIEDIEAANITVMTIRFGLQKHFIQIRNEDIINDVGYAEANTMFKNRDHSPKFFRQTSLLFHKWLAKRFNLDDA